MYEVGKDPDPNSGSLALKRVVIQNRAMADLVEREVKFMVQPYKIFCGSFVPSSHRSRNA